MVDFFGIDLASLSSIANIFSGLATLVLAYLTWLIITQSRKDYAVTRKQLLMAQREKDPKLIVESMSFSGDSLSLKIKNKGKSEAQSIAVITSFYPAKVEIRERRINEKGEQIPYGTHIPIFKKFRLTIDDVTSEFNHEECANYISKGKKEPIILAPGADISISVDLCFAFQSNGKDKTTFRTFSELKTIMKENGFEAVNLQISLAYKNILEDVVSNDTLAEFIFNTKKHTSLEEAKKDGYGFELRWLSSRDIETNWGWNTYSSYKGKTSKNYFPEERELEEKG